MRVIDTEMHLTIAARPLVAPTACPERERKAAPPVGIVLFRHAADQIIRMVLRLNPRGKREVTAPEAKRFSGRHFEVSGRAVERSVAQINAVIDRVIAVS